MFRVTHVLVLLFVAGLAGPTMASADGAGEGPDALYFLPPATNGAKNFTTYAPNATEPFLDDPDATATSRLFWTWAVPGSPAPWTLSPDDTIVATVHIEGLERVVPTPDPRAGPEHLGKIRINVEIYLGGGTTSDAVDAPIYPSYANATGSVWIDPPLVHGGGPMEIEVPVRAVDTFDPETNLEFAVRVAVSGTVPAEERPRLLVGSSDTPSHIVVSSFPVGAFRAMEDAVRTELACREEVLTGGSCDVAPPPVSPPPVTKESPGPAVHVAVLALLVLIGSRSRGRTPHRGSRPTSPRRGRTASR